MEITIGTEVKIKENWREDKEYFTNSETEDLCGIPPEEINTSEIYTVDFIDSSCIGFIYVKLKDNPYYWPITVFDVVEE